MQATKSHVENGVKRRNIFLINRPFQLRFSFYVCSWLVALSFVYPLIVNNLFGYFIRYAFLDPMGPSVATLQRTRGEVTWLLISVQIIFLFVTFLISIFMSHRIAGPLFKLRKFFAQAKEGDLSPNLQFRKADHFPELAKEYNEMMEGIANRFKNNLELLNRAITDIEGIAGRSDGDSRKKLENALGSLREFREKIPH